MRDEVAFWRHIGIYGYRSEFLKQFVATPQGQLERAESLEQLRALQMGADIFVLKTEDQGIGVDTAEDLARAERMLHARYGSDI